MSSKRKIEVFSAGCPACEETVALVNRLACPSCKITILDMKDPQVARPTRNTLELARLNLRTLHFPALRIDVSLNRSQRRLDLAVRILQLLCFRNFAFHQPPIILFYLLLL